MTSIPASRRARATTFAPRSCPSRPGFATTTRMRSAIATLHTKRSDSTALRPTAELSLTESIPNYADHRARARAERRRSVAACATDRTTVVRATGRALRRQHQLDGVCLAHQPGPDAHSHG